MSSALELRIGVELRKLWVCLLCVCVVVAIVVVMFDVELGPIWIDFRSESKRDVLWSYGYAWRTQYWRAQYVNGQPYYGGMIIPLSPESLETFGRELVFYYKTLDSKYQNVTYYYSWHAHNDTRTDGAWSQTVDEFSISVIWTHDVNLANNTVFAVMFLVNLLVFVSLALAIVRVSRRITR